MQTELDDYESRCHGVGCDKRINCQRHQERESVMPWTPILPNVCKLEGKHWYIPIVSLADPK